MKGDYIYCILTSTLVSNVGLGAQAPLVLVANGIPRAIVVAAAGNNADALYVWIGIWYCALRARALIGALRVGAYRAVTASIAPGALVDV